MTSNYTNTYRNILLLVDEEEEKTRNKHNTHSSQGAREPGSQGAREPGSQGGTRNQEKKKRGERAQAASSF